MAEIFVIVACLRAQQPANKSDIAGLLTQLKSDQWAERAKAYEQLSSEPKGLDNPKVKEALLDVLDRENRLIESTLRDSLGQVGVSDTYGEGFGEYVGDLGETVDSFANWSDSRQVCIFVHESYNPDSKFAAKIASHAKVAVPCLIQMYGSDVGLIRAKASPVLVQVLAKAKDQLDPNTIDKAKQVIARALRDPEDSVRSSSVRALGKFGGEEMIPALKQVSESDPSPEVQGHSIRKSALDAIAAIQKRALK
jgi:hypothetical protein